MIPLLIVSMLVAQGGTVSGILKDSTGKPAAGVRVAAIDQSATTANSTGTATMARIVKTDAEGRYVLDDIPPGRYYISAGRVDRPTYYPGVQNVIGATSIDIRSGLSMPELNFILSDLSIALPVPSNPEEMLRYIHRHMVALGTASYVFALNGVSDRTVSFISNGNSFSYGCPDCTFLVKDGGVGPQTKESGITFMLIEDRLSFKCQASQCNIAEIVVPGQLIISRLTNNQSGTASTSKLLGFAFSR